MKKKPPLKTDSEEFNEANLTLKLIFSDMSALVPTSSSMNAVFRSYSVLYDLTTDLKLAQRSNFNLSFQINLKFVSDSTVSKP